MTTGTALTGGVAGQVGATQAGAAWIIGNSAQRGMETLAVVDALDQSRNESQVATQTTSTSMSNTGDIEGLLSTAAG